MPTTTRAVVQLPTRTAYPLPHRAKVNRDVHHTTRTQLVIKPLRERLETTEPTGPRVAAR